MISRAPEPANSSTRMLPGTTVCRAYHRQHGEDTNIKLSSVVTDITGASARDMLTALLNGETDPAALAALARGKLRAKQAQLTRLSAASGSRSRR